MANLLLIDDDPSQLRLLERWAEREGWTARGYTTGEEGLGALSGLLPDAVVLDLYLAGEDGLEILSRIAARHPGLPVVMLTAETKIDTVVDAMRRGAFDYITKPMSRTKVVDTLLRALEKGQSEVSARGATREAQGGGFGSLLGRSPAMQRLFQQLDRVAPSEVTVLIQGESGTGKELVARAIHDHSGRSGGPFVAINCAAIPESLQESELFGHEKGAFTGASSARQGRFEQANGGTLFLDELGELSLALQAKLLRALQERCFYRVGGDREIRVDVRILAATHRDLEAAVADGSFREDLFYRLAVYELALPPLRDRGDDVLRLAEHLLRRHGAPDLTLSPEVRDVLKAYAWPGNVRELDNAMARATISAEGSVGVGDLPPRIANRMGASSAPAPSRAGPVDAVDPDSPLRPMEQLERAAIVEAMQRHAGNLSAVMRELDIPRTSFYRKLKKYGLRS
jgi:DNA-binding NtrC family response regulator